MNDIVSTADVTRRVLLIENSVADRRVLRNWLATDHIEVHEATDLLTGLAACSKFHPDLILLELRLPGLDGFETIRRLKDNPLTRSIPVIFLSAATSTEKAKGLDLGAVDFVSKPFEPMELRARVRAALRTKYFQDLLESQAHLDGLTGLGNRRALENHLPIAWESCRRSGTPLSILIADLDRFKKINDTYGHAAGDEVLRRAALTLRNSVRAGEFVARYGGEELVVVASHCDQAGAILIAERFRNGLAGLTIPFNQHMISVTSSVGVAVASHPHELGIKEVVERTDQALYEAKSSGRNAVWVWDSTQTRPVAARSLSPRENWVGLAG